MKYLILLMFPALLLACSPDEETNQYSGKIITYSLFSGSEAGSAGEVQFKERTDESIDVIVKLDQYTGNENFPVHLHFGDLSNPDAPQATLLSNFDGEKGESRTNIVRLADESLFTFDRIPGFNGSVKIHLADTGPDYDVIISAGNIGSNEIKGFNLQSIAVCSNVISSQ
jgi:hypothetical protein